jgi:hypothetical protein
VLRNFRIASLLLILIVVALGAWTDRIYTTQWTTPLRVALYPVAADGSAKTHDYVTRLTVEKLNSLEPFFAEEAAQYGLALDTPVRITLAPAIAEIPPLPPKSGGALQTIAWSLHLRWWAWQTPPKAPGPTPQIRIFLLFHDPALSPILEHSVGLQKGLLGIANLFASREMEGSNQVVIAHELLHTVGATDKYDTNALPLFPNGYAEPDLTPRFPQHFAELMAGRVPDSPTSAHTPESLADVVVGPSTATEIGWTRKQ